GWEVVDRDWREGRRAGFADLSQLSFTWNVDAFVGLANLAHLHSAFLGAGADSFVVVGPLEVDLAAVRAALPNENVSFVRLDSSVEDRLMHAQARRRGGQAKLAGDDLLGAPEATIDQIIATSKVQSA